MEDNDLLETAHSPETVEENESYGNDEEPETKGAGALDVNTCLLRNEVCDENVASVIQAESDAFLAWNQHGKTQGEGKGKNQTKNTRCKVSAGLRPIEQTLSETCGLAIPRDRR